MSSNDEPSPASAPPTVFVSYATQDRQAARALLDTLASFGLEVWLDESELGGGDAWDQKIRRQIRDCDYFMPLISAQTEARVEGYFRREWRLAVERTLDMADDHLFLLPVAIDDTNQAKARVPEKFLAVQWLKVPAGKATPALEALCRRLASGQVAAAAATAPRKPVAPAAKAPAKAPPEFPLFPAKTPGQHPPYGVAVIAWAGQTAWAGFMRLPRWLRVVAYIWIFIAALSELGGNDKPDSDDISPDKAAKLKAIAQQYQGSANKADIAQLGAQIAKEITGATDADAQKFPLLTIPFQSPAGDAATGKLADAAFATVYGRLALARHGHVALSEDGLPVSDVDAAVERGRAGHARYVLYGAVQNAGTNPLLTVRLASVEGKSILWAQTYALAGTDPAKIAAEIEAKVPSLEP